MGVLQPRRVYVDTSVFGGFFDEEFASASRAFFEQVEQGRFLLLTSVMVAEEVAEGPIFVRELFDRIAPLGQVIDATESTLLLQAAYIEAGILGPKYADDALHVALATVGGANLIVSWNFRHIVHFEKLRTIIS